MRHRPGEQQEGDSPRLTRVFRKIDRDHFYSAHGELTNNINKPISLEKDFQWHRHLTNSTANVAGQLSDMPATWLDIRKCFTGGLIKGAKRQKVFRGLCV